VQFYAFFLQSVRSGPNHYGRLFASQHRIRNGAGEGTNRQRNRILLSSRVRHNAKNLNPKYYGNAAAVISEGRCRRRSSQSAESQEIGAFLSALRLAYVKLRIVETIHNGFNRDGTHTNR
jgi:hypothetical protein